MLMREKIKAIRKLAELAENSVHYGTSTQLSDFFQSQILDPIDENLWKLPKFYVIPKIHKTPISARPILPCHSVVQGPAGKFVSKMLKGIVKTKQGIIHGSKDLALKLHSLKSLPSVKFDTDEMKRLYLVSGDVVAFYPNVNIQKAHQIASDYLIEYYGSFSEELDLDWVPRDVNNICMFREALSIANDKLLCQFDGKIYRQVRGLAMGVASSPNLANLYSYFFEDRVGIHSHPDVFFYGRYIDDYLGLVYAKDELSAKRLLENSIVFDNCTIEWSVSDSYMTFLDMTLFFDKDKTL